MHDFNDLGYHNRWEGGGSLWNAWMPYKPPLVRHPQLQVTLEWWYRIMEVIIIICLDGILPDLVIVTKHFCCAADMHSYRYTTVIHRFAWQTYI